MDVPQLIRDHQAMANEQPYKPPSYPPSNNMDQQPQPQHEVHNHWHQTMTPEPSRRPWHRRRGCVAVIGLAAVFVLIAIAVGIALTVVYVLKGRDRGHEDAVADVVTTSSTTEISSTTSISSETTSELPSSTATPLESVVTIIITASESSDAVETETATLTVTASDEEDLGAMLSSILSDLARVSVSTEVVTVSVTPSHPTTTSSPSPDSTSASVEPTSAPPSVRSTASSSTPSSTSSAPPTLATDSNLAAVDVTTGPASLHRRLLIWQDSNQTLIASNTNSDSQSDTIAPITSNAPAAIRSTPLTATVDDTGAVHLFYIAAADGALVYLEQDGKGSWVTRRQSIRPRDMSSLSATWHKGANTSGAVVLAYQATNGDVMLYYGVNDPESDDAAVINISNVLDLDTGDWDYFGLGVASAKMLGAEGKNEASLQMIVEGRDDVLAAECLFQPGTNDGVEADCYWLNSVFTGKPFSLQQICNIANIPQTSKARPYPSPRTQPTSPSPSTAAPIPQTRLRYAASSPSRARVSC